MTEPEVLKTLEAMTTEEFDTFLKTVPARTQLLIVGGFVSWRECLPAWYIKKEAERVKQNP